MPNYVVNREAQPNGDHEVHQHGCSWMPALHNQHPLGWHSGCQSAVMVA